MKHFHDLKYSEFIEFLEHDSFVSEKIDGSCFRFGVDSEGFYTAAKGSKKYRCQDDYDQYWHNDYRYAHIVAEEWWEEYGYCFPSHLEITAEIVACNRPNAILYPSLLNYIYITSDLSPFGYFDDMYISDSSYIIKSLDGISQTKMHIARKYCIKQSNSVPLKLSNGHKDWLKVINKKERACGDLPLRVKSDIPDIKYQRELLKKDLTKVGYSILEETYVYLNTLADKNFLYEPCYSEGIVVTYGKNADKQFKITFPNFTMMNEYYHKWHEKILSKKYDLDELLAKYLKNPYNDPDVHARTLLLFSEERKRLT